VPALPALSIVVALIAHATPIDPPSDLSRGWTCRVAEGPRVSDVSLPTSSCRGADSTWKRAIDIDARDESVAIALGVPAGHVDVTIDGAEVPVGRTEESAVVVVRVPPAATRDSRVDVVVRVTMDDDVMKALPWVPAFGEGPLLVGRSANVTALAHERAKNAQLTSTAVSAALSAVFLMVALYHVLVWLMRRSLDGYLWFGVFAFVANAYLTVVAFTGTALLPLSLPEAATLGNFVGALTNAAFIEFLFRYLAQTRPPKHWRVYQALLVVISGLGLVPHVGLAWSVSMPVVLLKVLVPVLGLVEIIRFIRKGSRDAWFLLGGIIFGVLGAPLELLAENRGMDLPLSPGQVAFGAWMITMAVALARQFARTLDDVDARNKELAETNRAIQRFVPFAFLTVLGKKSVREVNRGDSVGATMTVMFCDLRGFTALAEKLGPEQTFSFINQYLAMMEPRIHAAGGFINQYLGDGIMALFPSADSAVDAAVGMARAVESINGARAKANESQLRIGIGVHTGQLMLGTIGGGDQLDSGVVGDCVNTAARLEGITKMYGACVLISGDTMQKLTRPERFALRPLDFVRAKGKSEPLSLIELLDAEPKERRSKKVESRGRFELALAHYRKGAFADAASAFRSLAEADPGDGAAAAFRDRCGELEANPPAAWDGVLALTRK
jgi:class 3 adenylate cyclase